MADEDTTSADDKAQDPEIGEMASDEATGTTLGSAQPEASEQQEASTENEDKPESSPESTKEPETSDNSKDDFNDWAAKKNLPLDDPEKLGRMYRDLETKLGSKERKGQLDKAVDEANISAGTEDVQALKNQVAALSFYVQNPEAKTYEDKMVEILDEKPWLAGDLEAVLDIAKGRSATDSERLLAERQAGKKEALETVAQSQRAAPPRASATTRETPKEITDADIGKMSQAEYLEWRKTNDPFTVPL